MASRAGLPWRAWLIRSSRRGLAEVYDPLDPDRSDLDGYAALVDEFGAHSVLDIGRGTAPSPARSPVADSP